MVTVRSLERRSFSVLTPIFCLAASACSFSSGTSPSGSSESQSGSMVSSGRRTSVASGSQSLMGVSVAVVLEGVLKRQSERIGRKHWATLTRS